MRLHTVLACVAALFTVVSLFSHTVAARLLLLAVGIVLAASVLGRSRDVSRLPPIWIPFALWAGWAALSIAWSVEPERSVKEWRNEVFYSGAALWICYVGAQAHHAVRLLLPLVAAGALAAGALALKDFSQGFGGYQTGWHGGPGNLSSALLTLMPCAVVTGWYGERHRWPWWVRGLPWALAVLFLASAYTTLNRTIWLGFAAELIIIGTLVLRRTGATTTRTKLVIASVATAGVVACVGMLLAIQAQREEMKVARPLMEDSRLALWPEVLERAGERPLTGYGFGRGLLRGSLQEELRNIDGFLWHAHNIFLEQLLQTGVPGMLLFIALLAAIARAGWRLAGGETEAAAACGIALLGVLAGMLVRNMTDTLLVRQNALLFWAITGILLGLAARPWRA